MKVCITGASGFVGQNLVPLLKEYKKIEVALFSGDLLSISETDNFFSSNPGIDTVIHLAGAFSGSYTELIEANVVTITNLLESAYRHGVKKAIYISTGAVYGEPVGKNSYENDPLKPNTFYGQTKLWGEESLSFFTRNHGISGTVLRFPNVYGPRSQKGVIYNLLSDIKTKSEITIYGDGNQSRNFLHVNDACQAIILAIKGSASGIFNISNPVKTSINDLVKLLQKNYTFSVKYLPADNPLKDLLLDISLAQKKLGYKVGVKELRINDII
jgi:UDP-glucose 4-epimerase